MSKSRSIGKRKVWSQWRRVALFTRALMLAIALAAASVSAIADPAVSGINGKITALGGTHGNGEDDDGLGGLVGSLTLPLGAAFGAQADGAWARVGDEDFANAGLHLFWRDPGLGLLGIYGGYAHLAEEGGLDAGRVGVEAQHFAGKITIDLAAGYRFGDVDDDAYLRAKADYYAIDDLKISAGFVYEDVGYGLAAAEYQLSTGRELGTSLFADGRVHDEDRYTVMAGVKIYIGEKMSLINRHRRQDPDGYLDLDLIAMQAAAAAAARNSQSSPGGGGGGSSCPFVPASTCTARNDQCADAGLTPGDAAFAACGCTEGC